jgi:hypothetical protein
MLKTNKKVYVAQKKARQPASLHEVCWLLRLQIYLTAYAQYAVGAGERVADERLA